jgi:ABC-type transport system substrate-binding protein
MEITPVEPAQWTEYKCANYDNWDMYIWGTGAHFHPGVYATRWYIGPTENFGTYGALGCSEDTFGEQTVQEYVGFEFDFPDAVALMKQAAAEPDAAKQEALYKEVNIMFNEELPEIPFAYRNHLGLINNRVRNMQNNPNSFRYLIGIENWWLLPEE